MNSSEKSKILNWLHDTNKIYRESTVSVAGKTSVIEQDGSGGLVALLKVLRSGDPIDPEIAAEIAEALDPFGDSVFQIVKRSRRKRGRPRKDEVTDVLEIVRVGTGANAAILENEKAGKSRLRDLTTGDIAAERKISKAKVYGARKIVARARG